LLGQGSLLHTIPKQASFVIQSCKIWQYHSSFSKVKVAVGEAWDLSEGKVGGVRLVTKAGLRTGRMSVDQLKFLTRVGSCDLMES
jgi:hypothetical protein